MQSLFYLPNQRTEFSAVCEMHLLPSRAMVLDKYFILSAFPWVKLESQSLSQRVMRVSYF